MYSEFDKQPEEDDVNPTPATQGWACVTMNDAEWAVGKLRAIAKRGEAVKCHSKETIEAAKAWEVSELAKLDSDKSFFEMHLRAFTEKNAPEDKKSVSLINGTLQLKQNVITFIHDDNKLLIMAKTLKLNEFIKVTEEFKWGEYKKRLSVNDKGIVTDKLTGEITDITTEPITTSFSVKFKGDK